MAHVDIHVDKTDLDSPASGSRTLAVSLGSASATKRLASEPNRSKIASLDRHTTRAGPPTLGAPFPMSEPFGSTSTTTSPPPELLATTRGTTSQLSRSRPSRVGPSPRTVFPTRTPPVYQRTPSSTRHHSTAPGGGASASTCRTAPRPRSVSTPGQATPASAATNGRESNPLPPPLPHLGPATTSSPPAATTPVKSTPKTPERMTRTRCGSSAVVPTGRAGEPAVSTDTRKRTTSTTSTVKSATARHGSHKPSSSITQKTSASHSRSTSTASMTSASGRTSSNTTTTTMMTTTPTPREKRGGTPLTKPTASTLAKQASTPARAAAAAGEEGKQGVLRKTSASLIRGAPQSSSVSSTSTIPPVPLRKTLNPTGIQPKSPKNGQHGSSKIPTVGLSVRQRSAAIEKAVADKVVASTSVSSIGRARGTAATAAVGGASSARARKESSSSGTVADKTSTKSMLPRPASQRDSSLSATGPATSTSEKSDNRSNSPFQASTANVCKEAALTSSPTSVSPPLPSGTAPLAPPLPLIQEPAPVVVTAPTVPSSDASLVPLTTRKPDLGVTSSSAHSLAPSINHPDLSVTLPRSFGSQLETPQKIMLGLPVPAANENLRPVLGVRRATSSSVGSYEHMNGGNGNGSTSKPYHPASAFDPPPREPLVSTMQQRTVTPRSRPDDGIPMIDSRWGSSLTVGIPCIVALTLGDNKVCKFKAKARYIGRLLLQDDPAADVKLDGEWVGVEVQKRLLDKNRVRETKSRFMCNGVLHGIRYFWLDEPANPATTTRSPLRPASHSNLGLTVPPVTTGFSTPPLSPIDMHGGGTTTARFGSRSASTSPVPWKRLTHEDDEGSSLEHGQTTALFVRPHEVVFVLGATE